MGYKRVKFNKKGFDELEYKKYFSQNQAEYIRIKLRSVKLYSEGIEAFLSDVRRRREFLSPSNGDNRRMGLHLKAINLFLNSKNAFW